MPFLLCSLEYVYVGPTTQSGRRTREKQPVDYREPNLTDLLTASVAESAAERSTSIAKGAEDMAEYDYERDRRIVENDATKLPAHWVVNNRGLWARLTGRFRLPQDIAKRAARQ